jgi:hypothetical protein
MPKAVNQPPLNPEQYEFFSSSSRLICRLALSLPILKAKTSASWVDYWHTVFLSEIYWLSPLMRECEAVSNEEAVL